MVTLRVEWICKSFETAPGDRSRNRSSFMCAGRPGGSNRSVLAILVEVNEDLVTSQFAPPPVVTRLSRRSSSAECDGCVTHIEEIPMRLDPNEYVCASAAGSLAIGGHTDLVEEILRGERDFNNRPEAVSGLRVQVYPQFVWSTEGIRISRPTHRPGMEGDGAHLGAPREPRAQSGIPPERSVPKGTRSRRSRHNQEHLHHVLLIEAPIIPAAAEAHSRLYAIWPSLKRCRSIVKHPHQGLADHVLNKFKFRDRGSEFRCWKDHAARVRYAYNASSSRLG